MSKTHRVLRDMKKLFAMRGVLYLITRFCGSRLRRCSFNEYYKSGGWDRLDSSHSSEIVEVVERYARKGRILDMGCGTGILASRLADESFSYYRGVDASSEAVGPARKRASEKIDFEIGDIQRYECCDEFDCIVFEESLYYVPFFRYRLLNRYSQRLRPGGVFVVTISDPKRFSRLIDMIRDKFEMVEDRPGPGGKRQYLVFRGLQASQG